MWPKVSIYLIKRHFLFIQEKFHASKSFWKIYPLKNIYKFLIDNNLSYKYQSGSLPHHSTVFQLIDIFHNIYQAFDNTMFSCIVFCDVSKAFDRVWHKGLLFKLRQNGIDGKLLEWLSSYLSQRKQKVLQAKVCARITG